MIEQLKVRGRVGVQNRDHFSNWRYSFFLRQMLEGGPLDPPKMHLFQIKAWQMAPVSRIYGGDLCRSPDWQHQWQKRAYEHKITWPVQPRNRENVPLGCPCPQAHRHPKRWTNLSLHRDARPNLQQCRLEKRNFSQKSTIKLRPFSPPRGVLGPFGPKVGNRVENEFSGPSGLGSKSYKTESKKSQKVERELKFPLFDSFSTLLLTSWTPGREAPGTHFQLHFQLWARRAQELLWGDWRVTAIKPLWTYNHCKDVHQIRAHFLVSGECADAEGSQEEKNLHQVLVEF